MQHRWIGLVCCLGLAACGNPIDQVERVEDIDAAETVTTVAALPDAEEVEAQNTGFFARMLSRRGEQTKIAHEGFEATAGQVEDKDPVEGAEDSSSERDAAETEGAEKEADAKEPDAKEDEKPKSGGVFSFLRRSPEREAEQDAKDPVTNEQTAAKAGQLELSKPSEAAEQEAAEQEAEVQVAALVDPKDKPRRGLFGLRSANKTEAEAPKEPDALHQVIPFGQVKKICGRVPSELGTKLADYPSRRPKYRLYDSNPANKDPHALYVTGFADGCARQIWASVAIFGSVQMHEQLRYVLPDGMHPYSETDKAYEKVKRKVCGAGRKKPCGKDMPKLARNTVFVSAYDRYGDAKGWANLLLHDGELVARDVKSN